MTRCSKPRERNNLFPPRTKYLDFNCEDKVLNVAVSYKNRKLTSVKPSHFELKLEESN